MKLFDANSSTLCVNEVTCNMYKHELRMARMKTNKPVGKKLCIALLATSLTISMTMKQNRTIKNTASSFCN